MNWRRYLLVLHRDLGYFFTGVTVLYAISGLAVNHADVWNPSFVSRRTDVKLDLPSDQSKIDEDAVKANLTPYGEADNYRGFDFPSTRKIKIYLKDGDVVADLKSGKGSLETYRRRPILHQLNLLHLSPVKWWRAFSDCFAIGLLAIAMTGLLIARGRNGILGRGKWLVGAGLLIPLSAMLVL